MTGSEFCDILIGQIKAKNDSDLARKLGFTPAYISLTRKMEAITTKRAESFLSKLIEHRAGLIVQNAVLPIVEFFYIDYVESKQGAKFEIIDKKSHPELAAKLSSIRGVYAFYNSEGEIVYIGKTEKQNLLAEMTSAYNLRRKSYKMMHVSHAHGRWKPNTDSNIRQIRDREVQLSDTCSYFSAYEVSGDLIPVLEALLIRVVPNDIINVKMEKGKTASALKRWEA